MFYLPNEITFNIDRPLRILIVSPYAEGEDLDIDLFLHNFDVNLNNKKLVVDRFRSSDMKQIMKYFQNIRKDREQKSLPRHNAILYVTHGDPNGNPLLKEAVELGSNGVLLNSWHFLSMILNDAAVDCLGFIAVCFSGKSKNVELLVTGHTQFLHLITPSPGKGIPSVDGGKAIAGFINILDEMNVEKYTPELLQDAEFIINTKYSDIIKLWIYGDHNK